MRCLIVGLALTLAGCSSVIDAVEQEPSPDITKAKPNIITIASQHHLRGQLQIAGPIEAPPVSLTPWVICLRGASEARFTAALFYKGGTYVSPRESDATARTTSLFRTDEMRCRSTEPSLRAAALARLHPHPLNQPRALPMKDK
jgi:hypothetical protein